MVLNQESFYWNHKVDSDHQSILRDIYEKGFTPERGNAYFRLLSNSIKDRNTLDFPGQPIICFGAGRCGSTSLAALLDKNNVLSTHENPPFARTDVELNFHLCRMEILVKYFPYVSDISPRWLYAISPFMNRFPNGKIIGLRRDFDATVRSFKRITLMSSNRILPSLDQYINAQDSLNLPPASYFLIRTEELSNEERQQDLFKFLGISKFLYHDFRLNVGTNWTDGNSSWF